MKIAGIGSFFIPGFALCAALSSSATSPALARETPPCDPMDCSGMSGPCSGVSGSIESIDCDATNCTVKGSVSNGANEVAFESTVPFDSDDRVGACIGDCCVGIQPCDSWALAASDCCLEHDCVELP